MSTLNKALGLAAVAGLLVLAAPAERAHATSLISPGIAAAVQGEAATDATEVRWRRHHYRRYYAPRHYGWRHRHWRHRHWRHRHW